MFVRECASEPYDSVRIPPVFRREGCLSACAHDAHGIMIDANASSSFDPLPEKLFADSNTHYIHVHYAKRGCFAARVEQSA